MALTSGSKGAWSCFRWVRGCALLVLVPIECCNSFQVVESISPQAQDTQSGCRATRTGTLTRTQRSQGSHEDRWRQGERSRCAEEKRRDTLTKQLLCSLKSARPTPC